MPRLYAGRQFLGREYTGRLLHGEASGVDELVTSTVDILFLAAGDPSRVTSTVDISWYAYSSVQPPPTASGGDCCGAVCANPFVSLTVAMVVTGGTRISWQLDPNFTGPSPYTVVLQWSPSGRAGSGDWQTIGVPAVDPAFLVDPSQRVWGTWNFLRYRLVLTDADGGVHVSPPIHADGVLSPADALWAAEITRKERLRMVAGAGVFGYLLQERRYGTLCSCIDPVDREARNSSCPVCFGRNYVGGYHPAAPCWMADGSPEERAKMVDHAGGRGTVSDTMKVLRTSADLPVATNDIWVNHYSDERYRVEKVTELATIRDIPVVLSLLCWKLPRKDVAYRVPVARTTVPGFPCVPPVTPVTVCF